MRLHEAIIGCVAAGGLLVLSGAMASTVPVSQSFESFTNNHPIVNEPAWSGDADVGLISTDADVIASLDTYIAASGVLPLPSATHEKVLALTDTVTNTVASATGGVVKTEFLLLPNPTSDDEIPVASDDNQMGLYINTNSQLVVWHRDISATPTNQWLTLAGNPTINAGEWVRVTIHKDYATNRYQIAINGTVYTNTVGETRAGTTPGSWFHMVQTNGFLSSASFAGVTYVDDLVIAEPVISYSRTVFSELSLGLIDNTAPIEITISGDTFSGTDGSDFVAGGKVSTNNVPAGLTLVLTKDSDTKLLATLTGTAQSHASGDTESNLSITFQDKAITATDADLVSGYSRTDLEVAFNDSTLAINTLPYRESFETYADGSEIGEAQGWDQGGTVTTETAIVSALTSSYSKFPITTNHLQVLRLTQETTAEIKSSPGGTVFTDVMVYLTARAEPPAGSTDYQFAMFVDTNQVVNLWHRDTSGDTPTNTWVAISGRSLSSNTWQRVTLEKDYAAMKYRLYLRGVKLAVNNPTSTNDWFNMVSTNTYMSRLEVLGGKVDLPIYLDDLVVDTTSPAFLLEPYSGSTFRFR